MVAPALRARPLQIVDPHPRSPTTVEIVVQVFDADMDADLSTDLRARC